MNVENLLDGHYYLQRPGEKPVLVYLYNNPDVALIGGGAHQRGFGFNIRDGGGFLPLYDLHKDTIVTKVRIEECHE